MPAPTKLPVPATAQVHELRRVVVAPAIEQRGGHVRHFTGLAQAAHGDRLARLGQRFGVVHAEGVPIAGIVTEHAAHAVEADLMRRDVECGGVDQVLRSGTGRAVGGDAGEVLRTGGADFNEDVSRFLRNEGRNDCLQRVLRREQVAIDVVHHLLFGDLVPGAGAVDARANERRIVPAEDIHRAVDQLLHGASSLLTSGTSTTSTRSAHLLQLGDQVGCGSLSALDDDIGITDHQIVTTLGQVSGPPTVQCVVPYP